MILSTSSGWDNYIYNKIMNKQDKITEALAVILRN